MSLVTTELSNREQVLWFRPANGPAYAFRAGSAAAWTDLEPVGDDRIRFRCRPGAGPELSVRLDRVGPDEFTISVVAPPTAALPEPVELPATLVMETPGAEAVFPFYGEGLILKTAPPEWDDFVLSTHHLDLPLLILTDGQAGCLLLHDLPPDDGEFALRRHRDQWGAALRFLPQRGQFGYNRSVRLWFTETGGYVALLRRYREYLSAHGYLVPLSAKAAQQKAVGRLRGAVNLWGADEQFYRKCQTAGIEHAIANHGWEQDGALSERLHQLGYLVNQYQCYHYTRDQAPAGSFYHGHPEVTTVNAKGQFEISWQHRDGITEYDRCPAFYAEHASRLLPKAIADHGIHSVFLDITGAAAPHECYAPTHALTRTADREAREALLAAAADLGLVVGTEHGRWWTAKTAAYQEGMMTLQFKCPWDAGYLDKPAPGTDLKPYLDYGLSPVKRLPLYELVFHDCVVNYWYWGDSTDWLHAIDPRLTDVKDAMNVLTGTPPLVWVGPRSGFGLPAKNFGRFLQTTEATLPVHRQVFGVPMTQHEWITGDRLVQRTAFGNGIETWVNFGEAPFAVETPRGREVIDRNGFIAFGPDFAHHRAYGPASK